MSDLVMASLRHCGYFFQQYAIRGANEQTTGSKKNSEHQCTGIEGVGSIGHPCMD
jgi:hypothetical protein